MIAKAKGGLEMELSERKKQILRAVVENYIQTAEPVGSKAIVAAAGLKVSSATIRNAVSYTHLTLPTIYSV